MADYEITIKIKSGATTDADGTPDALPNSNYNDFYHDWATDPNTGQPWTWAAIDALQAGFDLKAGTGDGICTQLYVVVTYVPIPVFIHHYKQVGGL
ncbi:unnamed protein product [marine sediment metagenome]|uniref:Uncharacterized protein n=1 Tax=marine sediment metagenome TaxID=412755 RepID=X1DBR2_9ZZZZ